MQYATQAVNGELTVCKKTRQACQRFLDDLERAKDPGFPWVFDPHKAARPVDFIEKFLTPTKGAYDKMTLLPWQCFVECNVFGWLDKKTGVRRFREALVVVGTGNGKSTMLAGNATFGACKDGERGADIVLLANSREQAGIVFNECKKQIESSRYLAPRFRSLRDGVFYDKMNATIKARSSDSHRLDGLNPHYIIIDELHEYRTFDLINAVKMKMVKRVQPLTFYITTMGNVLDGPLVTYYDLFSDALYGKLAPEIGDRLFAFIAELDEKDDVNDSSLWVKANPSLGALLSLNTLRETWERVKLVPSERANFICKQLNIMVATDDMAYIEPEVLKRNQDVIPEESLLGRRCYGGFDLSSREDHTSAALEFPLDDGRVYVLQHSWVPQRKVEMNQEKLDYYNFAMEGLLTIVPGEYVDQVDVYNWFVKQDEKYEIISIGYDPANATRLINMLEQKFICRVVHQGPLTLNDPMKDIKEMLISGRVVSNRNPLLNWYTGNVRISGERRHTDKANMMPTKRNRYRKIDGFMAWLDAHVVHMDKEPIGAAPAAPRVRIIDLDRDGKRSRMRR